MKRQWILGGMLAVMLLGALPVTAQAAEPANVYYAHHGRNAGYCTHVHDEACGYVQAVEGVACACPYNEDGVLCHTEGCVYVEAVPGAACTHTHGNCYSTAPRYNYGVGHRHGGCHWNR